MQNPSSSLFSYRLGWLLPLLALAPSFAASAETLSLTQAIEQSLSANPQYRRAQAAEGEAAARASEALAGYLPQVSVSATHALFYKYQLLDFELGGNPAVFPFVFPQTVASLDLRLNLFDGLRTTNAYSAARLQRDAARSEAERLRFQVESEVRLRYYQALSAKLLETVADQNVATLEDHLAKTRALLRGGSATKLDALRVEVQLSEAIPERLQARDNVTLARRNLAVVMGVAQDERPLGGTLPVPTASMVPSDLELDVTQRGDIQALASRAEAADKERSASNSHWLPSVGFLAETQWYNNRDSSFNPDQFRHAYNVALNLSWDIFDWGAISRSRAAGYRRTEAEAATEAAALRAPLELEQWKHRFLTNVQLYQARTRAIETAQESVRLARLSYAAGARTSTEVLDTELDLFRARAGAVRAQVDAMEALINLELAVGRRLYHE